MYGKPIQNLDIENGITILDNLVDCIKTINCINDVCLGISEGVENKIYIDIANKKRSITSLGMSMMFLIDLFNVENQLEQLIYLE